MTEGFKYYADPEDPEWLIWEVVNQSRYNELLGPLRVRSEGEGRARCRIIPGAHLSNNSDNVHGGAILGFIDVALFGGARGCGVEGASNSVTLDCSAQFISPGRIGEPLDAVVDLVRETGRMIFLRGMVVQGDDTIASFMGTLRKLSARK